MSADGAIPVAAVPLAELMPRRMVCDVAPPPPFSGRIAMARVDRLCISPIYQRRLVRDGWRRVRAMAEAFDWAKFGTLIVRPIGDERVEVIDGQHRAMAALMAGIPKVPCVIVEGDAAAIFVAVNTCRAEVKPAQLFHAERAAGEPEAVALGDALDAAGIRVMRTGQPARLKPGETLAVKALRWMWRRRGTPEDAETVLMILTAAKGVDGKTALIDPVIRAITILVEAIEADADTQDDDALIAALGALERFVGGFPPSAFLDIARARNAQVGGGVAAHLARLVANEMARQGGPEIAVGV